MIEPHQKNLPAGMRPRSGQGKGQMAVHMSRVSAFFKTELAIANTTGDDERDYHPHKARV